MPARDYYLKDKTLETLCQREQRPTHTHTVAPVWRAERSAPRFSSGRLGFKFSREQREQVWATLGFQKRDEGND